MTIASTRRRRPTPRPIESPWLTFDEAAEKIGIGKSTFRHYRALGGCYFPRSFRMKNGRIRIHIEDLYDWLEQFRIDPPTDTRWTG